MRRFHVLPRVLLALVALPCALVFVVAALNTVSCCAIDPDRYPAKVAENKRPSPRSPDELPASGRSDTPAR